MTAFAAVPAPASGGVLAAARRLAAVERVPVYVVRGEVLVERPDHLRGDSAIEVWPNGAVVHLRLRAPRREQRRRGPASRG